MREGVKDEDADEEMDMKGMKGEEEAKCEEKKRRTRSVLLYQPLHWGLVSFQWANQPIATEYSPHSPPSLSAVFPHRNPE